MNFWMRQKARPAHICFIVCIALLAACGSGSTSATDQRDAIEPSDAAAENQAADLVSDDPSFPGNDIVLHEYGDPVVDSGNARPKAKPPYQPNFLSASEIRRTLIGHELTDGVHWSIGMAPNGRTTREENGRVGHGRWTIKDNEFCLDDLCHKVSKSDDLIRLWRNGAISIEAELR
jgi:hypothetical protein